MKNLYAKKGEKEILLAGEGSYDGLPEWNGDVLHGLTEDMDAYIESELGLSPYDAKGIITYHIEED